MNSRDKAFAIYAVTFVIAVSLLIPFAFAVSGTPTSWIPSWAILLGDLALGLAVRGYCLGFFVHESGHWSLSGS